MLRKLLAIVFGWMAGSIVNLALVTVSQTLYPLPAEIDPNDFAAFQAHVQAHGLPTGALVIVLLAHAGGSFVSGLVCGLIARHAWYVGAVLLGVLWTCGGVAMLMMIPAAAWFAVVDVVAYLPAALLGVTLGGAFGSRIRSQVQP